MNDTGTSAISVAASLRAIGIDPRWDFDLSYKQAATMLGLSVRSVRALVASGRLGCVRHNAKMVTVPLFEIREYRAKRYEAGITSKSAAAAAIRRHSPPSTFAEGIPTA